MVPRGWLSGPSLPAPASTSQGQRLPLPAVACPLEEDCPAPVSRCAGVGSIPGARWRWESRFPPCGAGVSPLGGQSSLQQVARLYRLSFGLVGSAFQVEFLDESKKGEK